MLSIYRMKNFLLIILTGLFSFTAQFARAYQITFHSNERKGIAYLTYYLGSNLNIEDSMAITPRGTAVFKQNKRLPGGIYAIVFGEKKYTVEFLLDKEQLISITADTASLINAVVTGSKENELFQRYQQFTNAKGKQLNAERTAYLQSRTKADSALHESNYNKYNTELNVYREQVITTKPTSLMAVLLTAMKESPVPERTPVTLQDSLNNFNYYKAHYWDGISFMDERVLRTPFFLPKMERYYREVIGTSAPDSIIKDIDYKLLYARNAPELYKFMLNWLTDEYINPKYMGQDAIFVHLFNKYHSKGLSPWLNAKQMEVISKRAYMQMANLIGEKAADLQMLDTAGRLMPLYNVAADYTVVIFWDPNCGHCKEELPKIDSIYRASWKAQNIRIYAVLSENQHGPWLNYINDHNLQDWVNVYETKEMADANSAQQKPGFRQLYDVTMTPTLFLLDKEKRIIGKKLNWKQVNELLAAKHEAKEKINNETN